MIYGAVPLPHNSLLAQYHLGQSPKQLGNFNNKSMTRGNNPSRLKMMAWVVELNTFALRVIVLPDFK